MKSILRLFLIFIVVILIFALDEMSHSAQAAGVLCAKPSATGAGDCSNWDNACTLQTALANAVSDDEIWVAEGTHRPTSGSDRTATFQLKSGVAVYGGFAGTETARAERNWTTKVVTLSGDLNGDDSGFTNNGENSYHVLKGATGATLDGVTVSGGNANAYPGGDPGNPSNTGGGIYNYYSNTTLNNVTFSGNSAITGGGMRNEYSSPTLNNVTFSGNSATYGGGMHNYYSSPTLNNVTFSGNSAYSGGGMTHAYSGGVLTNVTFSGNSANDHGGGMSNASSSPTLTNVTFTGNSANNNGGGMENVYGSSPTLTDITFDGNTAYRGGGMYNGGGNPTLTNVTFKNNYSGLGGGGMAINCGCNSVLTNITFAGNTSYYGGGMSIGYSSAELTNILFSGNHAFQGGGLNSSHDNSPTLTNATFSGNSASDGGAIFTVYNSHPQVRNSILWGDSVTHAGAEIYNYTGDSDTTVTYSDVQGGYAGTGNINADPLFVTAVPSPAPTIGGDLHLRSGSPAINAGDNNATNPTLPVTDRDGRARISGSTVDMGAFEFSTATAITLASFSARAANERVVLKWETGSELQIVGFNLWRREDKQSEFKKMNAQVIPAQNPGGITGSKYTYNDNNVQAGKTYRYKLEVIKTNSKSDWSDVIKVNVSDACTGAPNKPTLTAPLDGATHKKAHVTLKWSAVNCAATYEIVMRQGSSDGKIVDEAKGLTTTQYKTIALTTGKTYNWRARACNGDKCGKWSTAWSFKLSKE